MIKKGEDLNAILIVRLAALTCRRSYALELGVLPCYDNGGGRPAHVG